MLFDSLFVSILSELFYLKDEIEAQATIKSIELNMNAMLNSSESYNPDFIACILKIALKHVSKFRLDASSVSCACLNSIQQSLGIVLLEEYIILNEHQGEQSDAQPMTKRIKLENNNSTEVKKYCNRFKFNLP